MATYSFKGQLLANCEQELHQSHQKIMSTINDLEQQTQSSLQEWEGSVQEIYRQTKLQWDQATAAMAEAAGKAGRSLEQIRVEYVGAEKAGTALYGGGGRP